MCSIRIYFHKKNYKLTITEKKISHFYSYSNEPQCLLISLFILK